MRAVIQCFKTRSGVGMKAPRRLVATVGRDEIRKSLQRISSQYQDVSASLQQLGLQCQDLQKKLEGNGASKDAVTKTKAKGPVAVDIKRFEAPSVIQVTVAVQLHEGVNVGADEVKRIVTEALQYTTSTKEERSTAAELEYKREIEESARRSESQAMGYQDGLETCLEFLGITSFAALREYMEKSPGKRFHAPRAITNALDELEARTNKKMENNKQDE